MKKFNMIIFALTLLVLSSCSVVGGILKVGFVGGIIAVIVIILLIVWLISAFRGRN